MIDAPAEKTLFAGKLALPPRLADVVSEEIATAMFDGRISPGEALPSEAEIARDFGVSKPIAREALRQLAAAGLLSTQQGKVARAKALNGGPVERIYGYAVRSSLTRLREANEMRRVVETGIARLAAQRREKAGLAAMERALADMGQSIKNPAAFTEADILFHLGMALATGNAMIRVHMEGLRSVQREVSEVFSRRANRTDADWHATVARHQSLYEAIAAGDAAAAEQAVHVHFEAADIASLEVASKLDGKGRGVSGEAFSLYGRCALFTGANGGIGKALALGLAAQGANLVLHHFADFEGAEAVRRQIVAGGTEATVLEADFSEAGAAGRLAAAAAAIGDIDILIANAAIEQRGPWEEVTPERIAAHVAVNFAALLALTQRLVPPMAARGWGRVIALGSVMATRPRAETVIYASLKSAQLTALRAIGREVAHRGVTMNVIAPGAIETERNAANYADPDFLRRVVAKIPARRQGKPSDCVGPVIMLASEAGGYITGANIPVDGGWSIGDAPA